MYICVYVWLYVCLNVRYSLVCYVCVCVYVCMCLSVCLSSLSKGLASQKISDLMAKSTSSHVNLLRCGDASSMCVVLKKQFYMPKLFTDKAGVSGARKQFCILKFCFGQICFLDKHGASGARKQVWGLKSFSDKAGPIVLYRVIPTMTFQSDPFPGMY